MHEVVTREAIPPSPRTHDEDEEIDLMEHAFVLWRHRWVVVGVTLLCGLVALGLGLSRPVTYEAAVKLVISAPKGAAFGETTSPLTVATVRAFVLSQSLASAVVREFKLSEPPLGIAPGALLENVTLEALPDTNVVILRVRMPNAELAAKVANRVAELTVELAGTLSQDETVLTRDRLKAQLDEAQKRFDVASGRLETFKKQAQVEVLRKDLDGVLEQRSTLLPLLVQIEAEKARLAKSEEQLAGRRRVETLRRTIDSDPALTEAARERTTGQASLVGLEIRNEYLNSVYEDLDKQVASSRTVLSGLERQKAELVDVRRLDLSQLALATTLYAREAELGRLQTQFDLAKAIFVDVATRHEQVRLKVAGGTSQLDLIDRALPPHQPVRSGVVRNTIVAVVVGLALSSFSVLFLAAFRAAAARHASQATRAR